MTKGMFLIVLLSQCIFGAVASTRTCFEISPRGDKFIMAGSRLQVNCSFKMPGNGRDCIIDDYNVYNLTIRKGSKEITSGLFEYFEDKKILTLTIQNVTFEDDGLYRCLYDDNFQSMILRVGEPPGAPENLSCISRNFNDMRCSFALSKKRVNIPTGTIIKFRMYQQNWTTFPDSNYHCNNTICTCWLDGRNESSSSQFTFRPTVQYEIRVTALNKLGNKSTDLVIENTASIVKPDPVENIGINFTSYSRLVRLRWRCPKALTNLHSTWIPMDYKIVVTSAWQKTVLLVQNTANTAMEHSIDNITPFTNYTVTVQAKPSAAVQDIYWSDSSAVTFVTLSTVSENAVSVTAGSYMMLDTGRPVIYWKNPARRYWYGSIIGYKIMIEKVVLSENIADKLDHVIKDYTRKYHIHIYGIEHLTENITGMAVSGILHNKIQQEESYLVNIMVINTKGVSSNRSEMIVPNRNIGQSFRPRWVSVEVDDLSVYISWYMDPKYCVAVTSVTYYWCIVDTERPYNNSNVSCKGQFDWKVVNISDGCRSRISYEKRNTSDHQNMKYAVSVQTTGQLSGGMMWERFRFSKNEVPEKPLYSVSTAGTNLEVQILYGDYHTSRGGRPNNYSVEYIECLENDDCFTGISSGTIRLFPANFLNPVYTIGNLKYGTKYRVRVSSINSVGRSEYGKSFMITPANDENTAVAEALGGTSAGFGCVVLLVLAYFGRKKYNDLKREAAIRIPDNLDERTNMVEENNRKYMDSDEQDSGKGTGSSIDESFPLQRQKDDAINPDTRSLVLSPDSIGNVSDGPTNPRTSPAQYVDGSLTDTAHEKETFGGECEMCIDQKEEEISDERSRETLCSIELTPSNNTHGYPYHTILSNKNDRLPDSYGSKSISAESSKQHAGKHYPGYVTEASMEGKGNRPNDTGMNMQRIPEKTTSYVVAIPETKQYYGKREYIQINGETNEPEYLLNDN